MVKAQRSGSLKTLSRLRGVGRQCCCSWVVPVVKSADLDQVQAECLDFSQHTVQPGAIENPGEERFHVGVDGIYRKVEISGDLRSGHVGRQKP
jgi:hypothetical protein